MWEVKIHAFTDVFKMLHSLSTVFIFTETLLLFLKINNKKNLQDLSKTQFHTKPVYSRQSSSVCHYWFAD